MEVLRRLQRQQRIQQELGESQLAVQRIQVAAIRREGSRCVRVVTAGVVGSDRCCRVGCVLYGRMGVVGSDGCCSRGRRATCGHLKRIKC